MERDLHFWFTTLIRGLLALLAGSAIMVVPDMARTLLLLPIAVTVAILGLAAYGVVDSALVFVSSYMVEGRPAKIALRLHGAVGMIVGVLLISVVFERVQLEWFLTLAALQALTLAVGEIVVARHQKQHALSIWNYAAAGVAFCFACISSVVRIEFVPRLTHREVSWLVYAYLIALGLAQCVTSARMIYADYESKDRLEVMPQQA